MSRKTYLFILSIFIIFSSSCNKRVRYIHKKDKNSHDTIYTYNINSPKYRLKPSDVLHIRINTTDEKINKLFKIGNESGNNNRSNNGGEFYLSGFTVNDSGFVQVPILGTLAASGKTVSEFRNIVTLKTHEYLNDAIVNVKFVSFKVSFLGEIKKPGPTYIYQDNIDILEAVSRAGGITEYADLSNVTIVRKGKDKRIVYKLNLANRELLTSQKFYLYPDDIIIVEPIKTKIAQMNIRDYLFFLSAISSALTTAVLIINLTK